MIQVASINIQSKLKINCLQSESLTLIQGFNQGSPLSLLLCIIVTEVLAISIDADTKIKGTQIGVHETKIANFADDTSIFLRDFSCLIKIVLILKLSQNVSSSKINFSKSQTLSSVAYKNTIDKPRQMTWSQFFIKMVGVYFRKSAHDNWNWAKIHDRQFHKENSYLKQDAVLFERKKNNHKPNPLIQNVSGKKLKKE